MEKRCCGCMQIKTQTPLCEHCGYNENINNLPHQLPIGTMLQGRYEVGKTLGQGGFGITYIGWDHGRDVPVAIKEFYPNGVVNRESGVTRSVAVSATDGREIFRRNKERFLKEAHTLARLNDVPEIVHVYSLFEENNTAYIVMEYLKGVDLRRYIRMVGGKLSPELTFAILRPVMDALQKVHETDMVHRDISPDNIMLMNDGSAKLLDFGAARDVMDADPQRYQNQSTEAVLKHGFAPMEQYQRNGTLGPWTDVYALAATMYYCMTGRLPADAPNRIMDGEQIPWSQIQGLTPVQIQALEKAMEVMPKDRCRSVRELSVALFGEEKPKPKPEQKTQAAEQKPVPEKKIREKKPRKKAGKRIAALVAVAAAAAVAGAVFLNAPAEKSVYQEKAPEITLSVPDEVDLSVLNGSPDREISFADGSRIKVYLDGKGREEGRILLDENGQTAYQFLAAYDEADRVLYQKTLDGSGQLLRTDGFQYDDQGNVLLEVLLRPDGSVYKSEEYTYDDSGNVTQILFRNGKNAVTGETRYEYDGEGNKSCAIYLDEKGNKEGMTKYVEYQTIDVRLSAQADFEGYAAMMAEGGIPISAGIRPDGATTSMWEIDNGGGGGGGGSSKKPSSKINVAITEPEETVAAMEATEEAVAGPVEQRSVCIRSEYYDAQDRLDYTTVMTYDSRGREVRSETYDPKGKLTYTHTYSYDRDTQECTGYEYRSGSYFDRYQDMNDILGNTVRCYTAGESDTGYIYYDDMRNFSEVLNWDQEGNLDSKSQYSYDEYGISLGHVYRYWNHDNGNVTEYSYDADEKLQQRTVTDKDGNLLEKTEPQHDEDGNLIREVTYDADNTVIEQTDYTYDEYGEMVEYRLTSYLKDGGKQVMTMDGDYNPKSSITYDASGEVTRVYNYIYEYDANGNKTKQSVYMGDGSLLYWSEYIYDENGNLLDTKTHYN